MTARPDQWVGRSLMAVRRLVFEGPSAPEAQEGGVEFLWDDRSTMRVDAVRRSLRITDRPWRDPFESRDGAIPPAEVDRVGRWVRRDVSRRRPFDLLIGHALTKATVTEGEVILHFGDTTVGVSLPAADPVVSVTRKAETREWWRVHWEHDHADEPTDLYYELVDLSERRKVEIWRDGRRGAASAFIAVGGSCQSEIGQFPLLSEIDADPQFFGEKIAAEQFQSQWQKALRHIPTTTLWRPTGPRELLSVEEFGVATVAATATGPAHLLSRDLARVCRAHCPRVECPQFWGRLCDALRGRQ